MNQKPNPRTHLNNPYEDENIKVHFVGDITFVNYGEIGDHLNPGYEICLIPLGKGFFKIQDKVYPIVSNQIFITKSSQKHAGWPSKDHPYRINYICFHIKDTSQSTLWKQLNESLKNIEFPITRNFYEISEIHQRLLGEILEKKSFSDQIIKTLIEQFIILTLRSFIESVSGSSTDSDESIQNLLSSRITHYINSKIYEKISLDAISDFLNYSPTYLCRIFKEQTGFTIMEYVNFARLEKSKVLLLKSRDSISSIAEKLGYSSIHHFSNSFKALYGYSPIKLRKSNSPVLGYYLNKTVR
jgi:AraC-like DNA-binding protein